MAKIKSATDECCQKCTNDINALKREVAALKRQLSNVGKGGADPRVDKLIESLKAIFPSKTFV